jgi:hypothetical protein
VVINLRDRGDLALWAIFVVLLLALLFGTNLLGGN